MTSFKALEQSGWTKKASAYDEHFKTDSVYAYTTWLSPQQGWDMFDLLMKAVQAHCTVAVEGQMRVRRCSSD